MVQARATDGSLERVKDEIDIEIDNKIINLQKKIKKMKVVDQRQELTVDLIKQLCFAQPVFSRQQLQELRAAAAAQNADVEETKSETTETTVATISDPSPSHQELVSLRSMRLGFQNIGPSLCSLELFPQLENLILSGNCIEEIPAGVFAANHNLQFLSLSRNKLTEVKNLRGLTNLQFLDISHNKIEEVDNLQELPPNLLALKLIGNPIEQRASSIKELAAYRKPFVLHLRLLEDMDKIEVDPAERMSYEGLLPRRINVDQMLQTKIKNATVRRQGQKLENELKIELKRDQGKDNVQIVSESLNEFAKMDEMDGWLDNLSEMMSRQDERSTQTNMEKEKRQERITKEVQKAQMKYGKAMTPKTSQRQVAQGSKRAGILEVDR